VQISAFAKKAMSSRQLDLCNHEKISKYETFKVSIGTNHCNNKQGDLFDKISEY
jgi:hypothetical protein